MKNHHLDEIIRKLHKYLSGDEMEISLPEMILIAFEEIKSLDEQLESLRDWVHDDL